MAKIALLLALLLYAPTTARSAACPTENAAYKEYCTECFTADSLPVISATYGCSGSVKRDVSVGIGFCGLTMVDDSRGKRYLTKKTAFETCKKKMASLYKDSTCGRGKSGEDITRKMDAMYRANGCYGPGNADGVKSYIQCSVLGGKCLSCEPHLDEGQFSAESNKLSCITISKLLKAGKCTNSWTYPRGDDFRKFEGRQCSSGRACSTLHNLCRNCAGLDVLECNSATNNRTCSDSPSSDDPLCGAGDAGKLVGCYTKTICEQHNVALEIALQEQKCAPETTCGTKQKAWRPGTTPAPQTVAPTRSPTGPGPCEKIMYDECASGPNPSCSDPNSAARSAGLETAENFFFACRLCLKDGACDEVEKAIKDNQCYTKIRSVGFTNVQEKRFEFLTCKQQQTMIKRSQCSTVKDKCSSCVQGDSVADGSSSPTLSPTGTPSSPGLGKETPSKYILSNSEYAMGEKMTCKAVNDYLSANCGITCHTKVDEETAALKSAIEVAKKKETCQSRLAQLDHKVLANINKCGIELAETLNQKMSSNIFAPVTDCCFSSGYYPMEDPQPQPTAGSATECQLQCQQDLRCAVFTWSKGDQTCQLNRLNAKLTSDSRHTSGPRQCSGCFSSGYYSTNGSPVPENDQLTTNSAEECQVKCVQNPKCAVFTWRRKDQKCQLKGPNAGNGTVTPDLSGEHTSGPKQCSGCFSSGYYSADSNPNTGSPIPENGRLTAGSAKECQAQCQRNSECALFTWRSRDQACQLNGPNAGGGELTIDSSGGHTSGPKYCSGCCFSSGYYSTNGSPVPENGQLTAGSATACQVKCQQNSECALFTWRKRDQACHLKNSNAGGGMLTPDSSGGHTSGPKYCTTGSLDYGDMLPKTLPPTGWKYTEATPDPTNLTLTQSPTYVTNPPLVTSPRDWSHLHLTLSSYQSYTDAKYGCGCNAEFTRAFSTVDEREFDHYNAASKNIKSVQCSCLQDAVCMDKDFMSACGEFLYGSSLDKVDGMPLVTGCTIECKSNIGMIVGIIIGVLILIGVIAAIIFVKSTRHAHVNKTARDTAEL